jgi:hypothetical protein
MSKIEQFNINRSFISQTGTLADTTLFTPATDGDFLVSVYMEDITGTASVQTTLKWTDDIGAQSITQVSAGSVSQVKSIHAIAGQPVTIGATDFGGSQTYNIFVVAVQFPVSS